MKGSKRGEWTTDRLERPAFGLEAELTLIVDDASIDPAALFGDPRGFIHAPLMHRVGTSYHLPNGSAVYFDTGVIEIATPAIELERGCVTRAARLLWEAIHIVRLHLDRWGRERRRRVRLQGFSTHYNVSIADRVNGRSMPRIRRLARALVFVLPVPVMLLGTNRRSTGVGVRPRQGRIEVTADFTPDPGLMIAVGSFVAGVVREVSRWPADTLRRRRSAIPVVRPFAPVRHTSRHGWLANVGCYTESPFACDVDAARWPTTHGTMSLRAMARRVFRRFARPIAVVADPRALGAIRTILNRRGDTLLSLDDRPASYDDVGSGKRHGRVGSRLSRSRYERVVRNAVERRPLRLAGAVCTPREVRGWSRVVFRRERDGVELVVGFDALVDRLTEWERG
jgi:hypothetical protein